MSLAGASEIVEAINKLGYPTYTPELIGYAKLAGLIAFVAPVPARLREWAYAGFTFELGAAVFSYTAAGYTVDAIPPAVIAAIVLLSWKLRQQPTLALADTSPESESAKSLSRCRSNLMTRRSETPSAVAPPQRSCACTPQ